MLVADNSGEVMEPCPHDSHQPCYRERMGLWQVALIVQCTSPLLDCTRWQRPQDRLLIQEHLPNLVAGPVQDREISIKVEKGKYVK